MAKSDAGVAIEADHPTFDDRFPPASVMMSKVTFPPMWAISSNSSVLFMAPDAFPSAFRVLLPKLASVRSRSCLVRKRDLSDIPGYLVPEQSCKATWQDHA